MLRYLLLTLISVSVLSPVDSGKATIKAKDTYQLPYIGKWHLRGGFYSSDLNIKKDGTFKFFERGCIGKCYTEGNWFSDKNEIVMTSYKRLQGANSDYLDNHSTISSIKVIKSTKGANWTDLPTSFIITYNFNPGADDTLTTYFDKAHLLLKDDTLYMTTKDTSSTIRKYVSTKNNR